MELSQISIKIESKGAETEFYCFDLEKEKTSLRK